MTNAAPSFELTPYAGLCWRFVEDQNTSSTMALVDSAAEQAVLEQLLASSKPPVPAGCRHLHYLQFTPFRYAARHATRFREQGERRGVFYASDTVETAATEVAFYRTLFFLESPETNPPAKPFEMTAFSTWIKSDLAVDIGTFPADTRAAYADPTDYAPCHALAAAVRDRAGTLIRFPSVRHKGGTNLAVLDCAAFAEPQPRDFQGWWFRFTRDGLFANERFGEGRLQFRFADIGDDPRVGVLLGDGAR